MQLLELVENGLMHAEDAELRERLTGLKLQRDEIAREAADLQKRMASGEPRVTPEKVARLAVGRRDGLACARLQPDPSDEHHRPGKPDRQHEGRAIAQSRAYSNPVAF